MVEIELSVVMFDKQPVKILLLMTSPRVFSPVFPPLGGCDT